VFRSVALPMQGKTNSSISWQNFFHKTIESEI